MSSNKILNKLINFLNYKLSPQVSYTCVPDDVYKPENLLSHSQELLNLGFMAYNVVKPPIELIFKFPHKIDIRVIKLWLKFNLNVKTTAVDIYANCNNTFIKIGEFNADPSHDYDGCLFYRSDLYDNFTDSPDTIKSIKFNKIYNIRSTTEIKIILKYTHRCCVPVLKKIEVWGLPSRQCTVDERASIYKKWSDINSQLTVNSSQESNVEISNPPSISTNYTIPEEFVDAITYEIMTLPMVLPSGKLVDQTTIERHTRMEMKNGRGSSDPFTGIPFTADRKPIFSHALKLQIDEFLMKHQNEKEVKLLPRAIGKKRRLAESPTILQRETNQISINSIKVTSTSTLSPVNLDDLVSNALKRIKMVNKLDSKLTELCPVCNVSNVPNFYKISTCGHLICRACLIKDVEPLKICTVCLKEYRNCNLIKHNRLNYFDYFIQSFFC